MTIGIILHPYGETKPAGLAEYIFELTKSLIEADKENKYIVFLKDAPKEMPKFHGNNWQIQILGGGWLARLISGFWLDIGLLKTPPLDFYIFNTPRLPMFWSRKSIVIILDFAYLYFRARGLREKIKNIVLFWLNKTALKRAHSIVAISGATKAGAIKFFGAEEDKISVIYPGFRDICHTSPQSILVPRPYFLFVGVIKERKNVKNLIRAFIEFRKKYKTGHKLVIAGKSEGKYFSEILDLVQQAKNDGLDKEIIFTGYLSRSELAFLYREAAALIFPSIVEGFGFPILEAMSCGTPVVTSKISSLGEVANSAALLVDPLNIEEIAEAMYNIVSNEILRKDLINRGLIRSKDFSWQKSAKKLIEIIKTNN